MVCWIVWWPLQKNLESCWHFLKFLCECNHVVKTQNKILTVHVTVNIFKHRCHFVYIDFIYSPFYRCMFRVLSKLALPLAYTHQCSTFKTSIVSWLKISRGALKPSISNFSHDSGQISCVRNRWQTSYFSSFLSYWTHFFYEW